MKTENHKALLERRKTNHMKTVKATAYGPKGSTFKCNWLRVSLEDLQRLTAHATLKGWPEIDITHFTESGEVHFWPPGYVTKAARK